MGRDREELDRDYSEAFRVAWNDGQGDFDQSVQPLDTKYTDDGVPILPEYVFGGSCPRLESCLQSLICLEPNNKYLDKSSLNRSPLSEAKAFLEQGGSLSEAALLLEAAIQQGELGEGGYEAWILLGETRNMDEREELGLRALTEGVRRSDAANGNGAGMLVCIPCRTLDNSLYDERILSSPWQSHTPTSLTTGLPIICYYDGYESDFLIFQYQTRPNKLSPHTRRGFRMKS